MTDALPCTENKLTTYDLSLTVPSSDQFNVTGSRLFGGWQANVWVYNDALVTLYHATDGQPGCVLVAGTGALFNSQNPYTQERCFYRHRSLHA